MECTKCGAKIPDGYVYCKVCGKEVQLVPDYNLLDDDILSGIVQGKEHAVSDLPKQSKEDSSKLNAYIWGGICVVILIAVLTIIFTYLDIVQKQQNSYAFQFNRAEIYFADQDYEQAARFYEKALTLNPSDKRAKEKLAGICIETGEMERARQLFEELAEEDAMSRDSIVNLMGLYESNEEYDKIIALSARESTKEHKDLFADYLVEQPKFSYREGTYPSAIAVEISAEEGHEIFYTVNGEDPAQNGILYQEAVALAENETTVLLAAARNEKGIFSETAEASYTICHKPPDTPKAEPAGGTYLVPQQIVLAIPEDCTAYYTWDGSYPTKQSLRYDGPLEMPQGNHVLSVIVIDAFGSESEIYRENYIYMP